MTPKEKAKELIDKFYNHCFNPDGYRHDNEDNAKQCALIAVDEVLEALPEDYQNDIWYYWEQVKQEIEAL